MLAVPLPQKILTHEAGLGVSWAKRSLLSLGKNIRHISTVFMYFALQIDHTSEFLDSSHVDEICLFITMLIPCQRSHLQFSLVVITGCAHELHSWRHL